MDSSYISDDDFIPSTTAVYVILQFIMSGDECISNDDFMASTTVVYVNLQVIMSGDEFYGKYNDSVCKASASYEWWWINWQ